MAVCRHNVSQGCVYRSRKTAAAAAAADQPARFKLAIKVKRLAQENVIFEWLENGDPKRTNRVADGDLECESSPVVRLSERLHFDLVGVVSARRLEVGFSFARLQGS